MRVFLGMGSNLGDSRARLRDAVDALGDEVVAVSPLYETAPLGGPPGQRDHLNVVVELRTDRTPRQLLEQCRALEAAAGRVRGERFGPRSLDVDILLIDDLEVNEPDLVVPHPRMYERRFVMAPLADLAPELVPPDWETRVEGFVARAGKL
jgi:2-amino-4-hydroxy-6-hydroxymethyldihydropteridine diphosphokinase